MNTDRLLGYKVQPFCGKSCCRENGTRRIDLKREKRSAKRRERQSWKAEVRIA